MKDESLPADDVRFDRLVDGALSPDEYRALLGSLDQEPGGWRSCALAFLESQALAGELNGLRRALDQPALPAAIARGRGKWPGAATLLAMAASFALAFGLGIGLPRIWQTRIWQTSTQEPEARGNLTYHGDPPAGSGGLLHEVSRPIANVRLVVNGEGGEVAGASELPVYEIGQNLEEYLKQSQPGLDPRVLEWLAAQGHEVELEQQFVPGQLEDGRALYVPVEQYQIRPVRRSY